MRIERTRGPTFLGTYVTFVRPRSQETHQRSPEIRSVARWRVPQSSPPLPALCTPHAPRVGSSVDGERVPRFSLPRRESGKGRQILLTPQGCFSSFCLLRRTNLFFLCTPPVTSSRHPAPPHTPAPLPAAPSPLRVASTCNHEQPVPNTLSDKLVLINTLLRRLRSLVTTTPSRDVRRRGHPPIRWSVRMLRHRR